MRKSMNWTASLVLRLLVAKAAVGLAVLLVIPSRASAQCTFGWRPGEGVMGVQGALLSLTDWDPDGGGPASPAVVVGGVFSAAGSVFANNVALWDGVAWQAMGNGIISNVNGQIQTTQIRALTVYNNEIIAGGDFRIIDGPSVTLRHIARWNGSAWVSMGSGGLSSPVNALIVHNGVLMAGISTGVVRWTGTAWTTSLVTNDQVNALHSFNGDLIAGGRFSTINLVGSANRIARWNGSAWSALGTGLTGGFNLTEVTAITSLNNVVYAGGDFTNAGGNWAVNVAKWDGTNWSGLGGGLDSTVHALEVFNNQILVGGGFSGVTGVPGTRLLASWNGTQWSSVGGGLSPYQGGFVWVLRVIDGVVWNGGGFTEFGTVPASGVATWNAVAWQIVGPASHVSQLNGCTVFGDGLVCGGKILPSLQDPPEDVAIWKGGQWHSFPDGVRVAGNSAQVLAVSSFNSPTGLQLIIAGSFTSVNGVSANNIARWNGTNWLPLSVGLTPLNSRVFALMEFNGRLIAGGWSGIAAATLSEWNGSTWSAFGTQLLGQVNSLTIQNGQLVAGGEFQYGNIVRWNGLNWSTYGPGPGGWVSSMAHYQGELVAAGTFPFVSRWDGSNWQPFGAGLDSGVDSLVLYDNELIAGGIFTQAGGLPASLIARWNGASWQSLGAGLGGGASGVSTMSVYAGELLVGGSFATAGSNMSARFARWGPLCPRGDMNCNQVINGDDVPFFISTLLSAGSLTACEAYLADMNGDNQQDGEDIAQLVACVTGSCP